MAMTLARLTNISSTIWLSESVSARGIDVASTGRRVAIRIERMNENRSVLRATNGAWIAMCPHAPSTTPTARPDSPIIGSSTTMPKIIPTL